MEYGFIVIKDNDYAKLFFIHYISNKNITMIPSSEPTHKVYEDIKNIHHYKIVYKPKRRGVCELHNLYLKQHVTISYNDKERVGQITHKTNDNVQIQFYKEPDKPTERFDFNYKGLSHKILNINRIEKSGEPINNDANAVVNVEDNIEDEYKPDYVYYYSIEQQVNTLLEELTRNIDINEYKALKDINKLIARYIEINRKYYTHSNNYTFKPLSTKPILNSIINNESIFDFYSDNISINYYEDKSFIPKNTNLTDVEKLFNKKTTTYNTKNEIFFDER